jgi:hypothetical protein
MVRKQSKGSGRAKLTQGLKAVDRKGVYGEWEVMTRRCLTPSQDQTGDKTEKRDSQAMNPAMKTCWDVVADDSLTDRCLTPASQVEGL